MCDCGRLNTWMGRNLPLDHASAEEDSLDNRRRCWATETQRSSQKKNIVKILRESGLPKNPRDTVVFVCSGQDARKVHLSEIIEKHGFCFSGSGRGKPFQKIAQKTARSFLHVFSSRDFFFGKLPDVASPLSRVAQLVSRSSSILRVCLGTNRSRCWVWVLTLSVCECEVCHVLRQQTSCQTASNGFVLCCWWLFF